MTLTLDLDWWHWPWYQQTGFVTRYTHVKHEGRKSYQSKDMGNENVFADRQTGARTNGLAKSYIPHNDNFWHWGGFVCTGVSCRFKKLRSLSWRSLTHLHVSLSFSLLEWRNFLSKATYYFFLMHQRWEAKDRQKERQLTDWLIDWLTEWCLTPFSTVFQLYHGSQCTSPCFPGVLLTSTPHNILSKSLNPFALTIINPQREYWPTLG